MVQLLALLLLLLKCQIICRKQRGFPATEPQKVPRCSSTRIETRTVENIGSYIMLGMSWGTGFPSLGERVEMSWESQGKADVLHSKCR